MQAFFRDDQQAIDQGLLEANGVIYRELPLDRAGYQPHLDELTRRRGYVTQDEVNYFCLFGTANIAVPITNALKRRFQKEHMELTPFYIIQPSIVNVLNFAKMLGYPLPAGV